MSQYLAVYPGIILTVHEYMLPNLKAHRRVEVERGIAIVISFNDDVFGTCQWQSATSIPSATHAQVRYGGGQREYQTVQFGRLVVR